MGDPIAVARTNGVSMKLAADGVTEKFCTTNFGIKTKQAWTAPVAIAMMPAITIWRLLKKLNSITGSLARLSTTRNTTKRYKGKGKRKYEFGSKQP